MASINPASDTVSQIVPFDFGILPVRVISRGGEPWFVLADVCRVLDIANNRNASARLDDEEKGVHTMDTLGGEQSLVIINESGLYSLILTSRKAEAKQFKKWVTSEVLPAIRRTGSYGETRDPIAVLNDPSAMRGLLLTYSEKVLALQAENAALAPKADALDLIAAADGSMCLTNAAKALQRRPKEVIDFLSHNMWIYRRGGSSTWCAYQSKIQAGLLEHKVTTKEISDGTTRIYEQALVTPRGLAKLASLFSTARLVA